MAGGDGKRKKSHGGSQKIRRYELFDPTVKAFVGWEEAPMPWTQSTCKRFIEWCHIDKVFPNWRHEVHLKQNVANLHYCEDPEFAQRCIEVYKFIYRRDVVEGSRVPLFIAEMVYAEVKLEREVDWSSLKKGPSFTVPRSPHIPRAPLSSNPFAGLRPKKGIIEGPSNEDYRFSRSSSSPDERTRWIRPKTPKNEHDREAACPCEPVTAEVDHDWMEHHSRFMRPEEEEEEQQRLFEASRREGATSSPDAYRRLEMAKAHLGYQVHTINSLERYFDRSCLDFEGSTSNYNSGTDDWTRENLIRKCQEEERKLEDLRANSRSWRK